MASIDIGSNTVRLLVGNVNDCKVSPVRYEQSITRLSRGLSMSGQIGKPSMDATIETLRSFKVSARKAGATNVTAAGTGALREAQNASDFIKAVMEQTGINIEVLPGHLEAEITALGVVRSLSDASNALILDIGGASTEVIAVDEGQTRFRETIATGVVKLLERYVLNDPPTRDELVLLSDESCIIGKTFLQNLQKCFSMNDKTIFISTAGTPTTLAAIDLGLRKYDHARVHGHNMSIGRIEGLLARLATVPAQGRVGMGCLEPQRADLIIPGLILTIGIMKSFGFHEMTVSDQGLLEGLLLRAAGCGH